MSKYHKSSLLRQSGFSLIEILVGLVIGLLATLVIMQAFSVFEGQKRSTSGTADAQTNGSIALMSIQRDVQMAGFGLALPMADKDNTSLKCNAFADYDPDHDASTDNSTNVFPVVIEDGAANADDVLIVRYSNNASMGAVPVRIVNPANAIAATGLTVDNNIGCKDGDIVLIMNGTNCLMTQVADANGSPDTLVNITLDALTPAGGPLAVGAKLACMGDWQNYRYEVVNHELRINGNPLVSEVVSFQAQYGVSAAANSNQVNQWVDATGSWAAPSVADRNRIKAIRVVVVARNGLLEKDNVTSQCTTSKGVVNNGPCAWDDAAYSAAPKIDLSANADWRKYRYKAFETIIPLRNMLWAKDVL